MCLDAASWPPPFCNDNDHSDNDNNDNDDNDHIDDNDDNSEVNPA